jgi:hypothetical protein
VTAVPAHVAIESYSVLTRLPGGLAVPARTAASVLARRFSDEPLQLRKGDRASLVEVLAAAGVSGGASYDGLVALEASAHGCTMLTLDQRAQSTYQRLGVPFRVIGSAL